MLPDMMGLVGGSENFGLIDVIDAQGFKNLSLHKVADTDLSHDRNAHGVHDVADDLRVGHAGHTAVGTDVSGNALQSHNRYRAGFFRYLCLLGVNHVHDDSTFEHLGVTGFDRKCPC